MLRKISDLRGFTIAATDDKIGSIDDFYFDDETWDIRYVVVDTGPWIFGRQVLISPAAVTALDWTDRTVSVQLTKGQVENSPPIAAEQPVSRQHEIDLHQYYGWPGYWHAAPGMATPVAPMGSAHAAVIPPIQEKADSAENVDAEVNGDDPHLRSVKEVLGYDIQATDNSIGHVEDFFVDENDWNIRYVLIDTVNWLPGRNVLVGTQWIDDIDWAQRDVSVGITREQVENSPEYNPLDSVTRQYEEELHDYYHFQGYWY